MSLEKMESDGDDFQTKSLSPRTIRTTYLITYSQADLDLFPARITFANAVVDAFDNPAGNVKVSQWVCSRESHKTTGGQHYHIAVKLTGQKRWLGIKRKISEEHGIEVHFSDKHDNYYTAYRYVTKEDNEFLTSTDHPDLATIGSPRTKSCVSVRRKRAATNTSNGKCMESSSSKTRERRLSNLDVGELIIEKNFKDPDQLRALAEEQRKNGKKDLANFLMNRSVKRVDEIFESTWKMNGASKNLAVKNRIRMEVLREATNKQCEQSCSGQWYRCALEVLQNNSINSYVFANALRDLISKGRGKNRNLMLIGPTNCGKTFLLTPLQLLYKCFSNPSNDKYAWIGVDECEVIFLNDFRWSPELISWKEFLLLLEGQLVHLPTPKNHYSKDIALSKDIPVFATGKAQIKYVGKFNAEDERETAMMDSRWQYFELRHQIPVEEQKDIQPCISCFSKLAVLGEDH